MGFSWTYLLAALLVLGLGLVAFRVLRKRAEVAETIDIITAPDVAEVPEPAAPPMRPPPLAEPSPRPAMAQPTPAARPVPQSERPTPQPRAFANNDGTIGIQIRPWLQLEFRPDRAAATPTEAAVQYELIVNNVGNAIAKNIRIEARMFNAGSDQDREIKAFFASPTANDGRNSRVLAIPPRKGARVRNVVAMSKQDMREITVEGRRLFIPMVAFNVIYEWGDGKSGQTSMSYLVGREPGTPSQKMGPFRLDQGPRVYRSVGQRPSQTAVLV
jgi:hypothetical protein